MRLGFKEERELAVVLGGALFLIPMIIATPYMEIDAWYFVALIALRVVLELFVWIHPDLRVAKLKRGKLDFLRVSFQLLSFVLAIVGIEKDSAYFVVWAFALTAFVSVLTGMELVVLLLHAKDPKWLKGTDGRVGMANWWTIFRIALAVFVPYIYLAQPFGGWSDIVAFVVTGFAFATDVVDGFLARARNEITEMGKFLDPLCDKVIFFFSFVSLLIRTRFTAGIVGIDVLPIRVLMVTVIGFIVFRDAYLLGWFIRKGSKLKEGMAAGGWDKLRGGALCAWTLTMGLALIVPEGDELGLLLSMSSLVLALLCMALSLTTLAVGDIRIRNKKV